MTPRRFLFWIHLSAGCVAGLVIVVMSATGVLLAYKRQIINFADRGFQSQPAPGAQQLAMDELLARLARTQGQTPSAITVRSDPAAPVAFDFGRERTLFMNPYSGQVLGDESPGLRAFFSEVEDLHRSLGRSAERRTSGHAITGACNLGFLVLVMTGPVLWWPKEWSRRNLKRITLLRRGPWVRARDWNWHNALGFWCVIPLFLIVVTGVIMSYGWANSLLYRIAGNEPPIQGSPAPLGSLTGPTRFDGLDKRFARARLQVPGWTAISVRLQNTSKGVLTFSIDQGNGGRPDLRSQLTLDNNAALVRWEPFSSYNRGRQLRSWARFTHTGEAFGLLGQTAAATASVGASLLVVTGLSLAFRRLASRRSRNRETGN